MQNKPSFRLHSWLLLSATAITLICSDCTCTIDDGIVAPPQCNPDGNIVTRNIPVEDFTELWIDASWGENCEITIEKGIKYQMIVQGPQNVVESVDLSYLGERMNLRIDPCLSQHHPILKIQLVMPELAEIQNWASGAKVTATGLGGESLKVTTQETGTFDLQGDFQTVELTGNNRGKFILHGSANTLTADLRNSSSLEAFELVAQQAIIRNYGPKDADVQAIVQLNASISDAGNIRYKGHPEISESIATGATGRVIDAN